MKIIRVLVVDDSALMRKMIPKILGSDPEIEVVGTAMDGLFALNKILDLKPDVITLDMSMPRMDGIETLRHVVQDFGIPVIVVSSLTKKDTELTLQALEIGAFDFVTKPQNAISVHIGDIGAELRYKVKAAYGNPFARLKVRKIIPGPPQKAKITARGTNEAVKLLAIGSSTGGPNALSYLLPQLPEDFPAAIMIAQHMPAGFTDMFARRLDSCCRIKVKEASDGDLILPGRALIAPGDRHLKVRRMPLGAIAVLSDSPSVNGHRPSVDVLFRSVASEYGKKSTALILTGMGADGAEGIGEIMRQGGFTMAQNEESCVVYGMPKVSIERNYINEVLDLNNMGDFLINRFMNKEEQNETVKS